RYGGRNVAFAQAAGGRRATKNTMSDTLNRGQAPVALGQAPNSAHGHCEASARGIFVEGGNVGGNAGDGVGEDAHSVRGPCVLVLQKDADDRPVHVVWGIPQNRREPAVVVTAYRPDPARWSNDFLRRKTR